MRKISYSATSLMHGHLFKEFLAFTCIADIMCHFDIGLAMRSWFPIRTFAWNEGYHMIECNPLLREDNTLADITPVTISFKDAHIINSIPYLCCSFDRLTSSVHLTYF